MANVHWASIPFFQIKTLFLGGFNLLLNDHINPNLATSFVVSHQISAALGETFFSQDSVPPVWLTPVSLRPQTAVLSCSCFRLASMAPVLACRVLPSIEVTMGYERDDNTRWGNWPNTNMVQPVKGMGARHNVREPYISFPRFLFSINISEKYSLCHYPEITSDLTLTLSFTKPMWMRRTKWLALHPSCGRLIITITIYLMVLEIWSSMSCACQPSEVTSGEEIVLLQNIHLCTVMNSYLKQ